MSFPRYPKYKASGVEWLGAVPEHWEVLPTKRLFRLVVDPAPDNNDFTLLSIYTAIGVRPRSELEAKGNRASTTDGYWKVQKGDLIVNKLLAWMGAIGVSEYDGVTSPAYDILRKKRPLDPQFYDFLFRCGICFTEFRRHSRGIMDMRLRLYFDDLGQLPMPSPPEQEQNEIVRFLQAETSKIDGLVGEQRRLIELLKEKRQTVISHAVTKGLNPHAPLKPSGIEWLGDVPEHWMVLPLHRVVQERRRITYGIVQPGEPDPTGRFMVRGQDYSTGWSNPDSIFRVSDAIEVPYQRARLRPGDLVVTIVGAGVGNIAVVPDWLDGANITQTTARIAVDPRKAIPEFVAGVLQGPIGKRSVELYAKGAAQPGLNLEHVRIFPVTVPPIDEQRQIAAFIHRETSGLDALTAEAERGIELLQERRTALISAAVTGQINVL